MISLVAQIHCHGEAETATGRVTNNELTDEGSAKRVRERWRRTHNVRRQYVQRVNQSKVAVDDV